LPPSGDAMLRPEARVDNIETLFQVAEGERKAHCRLLMLVGLWGLLVEAFGRLLV
jgi:hypothetical protein